MQYVANVVMFSHTTNLLYSRTLLVPCLLFGTTGQLHFDMYILTQVAKPLIRTSIRNVWIVYRLIFATFILSPWQAFLQNFFLQKHWLWMDHWLLPLSPLLKHGGKFLNSNICQCGFVAKNEPENDDKDDFSRVFRMPDFLKSSPARSFSQLIYPKKYKNAKRVPKIMSKGWSAPSLVTT